MVSNSFKSLVVGLGSIGYRHTKNLKKLGAKNISVFRSFKNKTKYPEIKKIKIFKNFNDAIKKNNFNLMILANPTSEHINYAIKGASNKINIYIEKPLSNSLKKN